MNEKFIEKSKRLHAIFRLEKRKLEQVISIDTHLDKIKDLNQLIDFVVHQASHILEADKCSLMFLDKNLNELRIRGAKGIHPDIIKSTRVRLGESISGWVAQTQKALLIENIETNKTLERPNRPSYQKKSFISVPIILHDELIGVVNLADKRSKRHHSFSHSDLRILNSIIKRAAMAIENTDYKRNLEYYQTIDLLTGVYNYKHFLSILDYELNRAERYPHPLCLMMIDIDDFATLNHCLGYERGSELLRRIAAVIEENSRLSDTVCRYVGDEFAVILPETTTEDALILAEKIFQSVARIEAPVPIAINIGIAQCSMTHINRRDFIMKVNRALCQAKSKDNQHIECFS